MYLSLNVRQYRLDHHFSQEYVAEKLATCQPNYSRLEKNDVACAKRLIQLAKAMDTTPETLTNYHLIQNANGEILPAEWAVHELQQKQEIIKYQQETIKIQNTYIRYVHAVITDYGLTTGKSLDEPPTVSNDE